MAKEYVPYSGAIVTREQAKAEGLTRFFTGKPCKHGHLSQRSTCNGGCLQCNEETTRALYYAETPEQRAKRRADSKRWKDANREQVRAAGRAYQKANNAKKNAWKAANRGRLNEAERQRRLANPEKFKAQGERYRASDKGRATKQAYYLANAEAIKARVNARRLAKPDDVRAGKRAWYAANKALVMQRVQEWNALNPEAARSRGRNYRARFKGAEGFHTGDDIKDLFVKQRGRCVYCGTKLSTGYHVDHITPLAKGGSNWPSNLQLTCNKCNNQKRATDPVEYARRIGLLI